MKLLLLSDPNSIHTRRWTLALAARGIDICLVGISPCVDGSYDDLANVSVVAAGIAAERRDGFLLSKLRYLRAIRVARRAVRDFAPDVVHAHYATSYGLLGRAVRRRPFVLSVWGADVYDFPRSGRLQRFVLKGNLASASIVCSTSSVMARETAQYTDKAIHVVPFGVDIERFRPVRRDVDPRSVTFGVVKLLEEKYGISFLIDAFANLIERDPTAQHRLVIVGSGTQRDQLVEQVEQLGLSERVRFAGHVDHRSIPEAFNEMDVVVVPSVLDSESFGVAAIEASACGKPVIVSNVGGLPEVVLDEVTGLVVPARDSVSLSTAMERLASDPALMRSLGDAGRQHVVEHYDWNANVSSMLEIYRAAIDSGVVQRG